jgi:hypothetical protein
MARANSVEAGRELLRAESGRRRSGEVNYMHYLSVSLRGRPEPFSGYFPMTYFIFTSVAVANAYR